jgi:hypothetical protein
LSKVLPPGQARDLLAKDIITMNNDPTYLKVLALDDPLALIKGLPNYVNTI